MIVSEKPFEDIAAVEATNGFNQVEVIGNIYEPTAEKVNREEVKCKGQWCSINKNQKKEN